MIAEKLGFLKEYTAGKSIDEMIELIFQNSGIQDLITYEDFKNKGYFVIPDRPRLERSPGGMKTVHDDPEGNPVHHSLRQLEFYSQNLAKHFPDDEERPPVPHWIEKGISHDERISSNRTAISAA
jgi:trimethylamine-N-oxide reductase (cytochrome c)